MDDCEAAQTGPRVRNYRWRAGLQKYLSLELNGSTDERMIVGHGDHSLHHHFNLLSGAHPVGSGMTYSASGLSLRRSI